MPKPTRSQQFERKIASETTRFRTYFSGIPVLLTGENANLPAALAFGFHLIETAHHRILYGCLCRVHEVSSTLARVAVENQHMTRSKFRELFANVVGVEISEEIQVKVKAAEDARDKMVHGKAVSDAELWRAILALTEYAIELNALVKSSAHFEAFGDMRGVTGRRGATPLNNRTSRWILKGMGFDLG